MDTGLAGSSALVTGASGGIGGEVARILAAEGCRLVLQAHRGLASLEREIGERRLSAEAVAFDVGDADATERAIADAASRHGGLSVCVASAGVWPEEAIPLDRMPPERIERVLRTNLMGTMFTARSFLAQARRHGVRGTSLVLVGSTAGRFGEEGHAEYAASKAALHGLMLSLKNEVVRFDPAGRVNLVEPGWTLTPMTEGHLEDATIRQVVATRALQQIARAGDVAAAIVYFASGRLSGHVTGETLTVSGGMEGRRLWRETEVDVAAVRARLTGQS